MSNNTASASSPKKVRLPATVAAALSALPEPPREAFIATRFPFTYAYDFLRSNPEAFGIPLDITGSRGRIGGFIRDNTADDEQWLRIVHAAAEAYLIHHQVRLPEGSTSAFLAATSLANELIAAEERAARTLAGGAR